MCYSSENPDHGNKTKNRKTHAKCESGIQEMKQRTSDNNDSTPLPPPAHPRLGGPGGLAVVLAFISFLGPPVATSGGWVSP